MSLKVNTTTIAPIELPPSPLTSPEVVGPARRLAAMESVRAFPGLNPEAPEFVPGRVPATETPSSSNRADASSSASEDEEQKAVIHNRVETTTLLVRIEFETSVSDIPADDKPATAIGPAITTDTDTETDTDTLSDTDTTTDTLSDTDDGAPPPGIKAYQPYPAFVPGRPNHPALCARPDLAPPGFPHPHFFPQHPHHHAPPHWAYGGFPPHPHMHPRHPHPHWAPEFGMPMPEPAFFPHPPPGSSGMHPMGPPQYFPPGAHGHYPHHAQMAAGPPPAGPHQQYVGPQHPQHPPAPMVGPRPQQPPENAPRQPRAFNSRGRPYHGRGWFRGGYHGRQNWQQQQQQHQQPANAPPPVAAALPAVTDFGVHHMVPEGEVDTVVPAASVVEESENEVESAVEDEEETDEPAVQGEKQ